MKDLVQAGALAGDADALEGLQPFAGLGLLGLLVIGDVHHLDVDLEGVAGAESGKRLGADGLHLLGFERLQKIHRGSPGRHSGR